MAPTPALDDWASERFRFRDLCECSETWRLSPLDNAPRDPDTFHSMRGLCREILDPIVARFGEIELTYGFAGAALARRIRTRIAPRLDQHAGHERSASGGYICARLGQAVDLRCSQVGAADLARFIIEATPFDRLYFYGDERPLHVSWGPQHSRARCAVVEVDGRRMPRPLKLDTLP